jgi:Skp family chaperone for outer membrane proteins
MKKLILLLTLFVFNFTISFADTPHFIDFNKVLNKSKAGAAAQTELKKRFSDEDKKFKQQETNVRKEESEIISQKKLLTKELRKKVSTLQKNKRASLKNLTTSRANARQELLKAVNPIIKQYMEENNIRIVLDKQSVLMGDKTLEITEQVITILNKEVSKLKLN